MDNQELDCLLLGSRVGEVFVVLTSRKLPLADIRKIEWLLNSENLEHNHINGSFIGPKIEYVSPWSTNTVEILKNMNIDRVYRVEKFIPKDGNSSFDSMLENSYSNLNSKMFGKQRAKREVRFIENIEDFNVEESLALSKIEIEYLNNLSISEGRLLTSTEIFGFAQINSEHCRHKIFNAKIFIDKSLLEYSLFDLIRLTSKVNPNRIVSAYSDNVAFIKGAYITEFYVDEIQHIYKEKATELVLSLKAETHNFPTTVEPFHGAGTGTGGEIRDRLSGGKGSCTLSGNAVYMTSYPRTSNYEVKNSPRDWLYRSPSEILIGGSNGVSDYGNKFGQPLICGSIFTFEHQQNGIFWGYDKTLMLAGGVGYANTLNKFKDLPNSGDKIILLGGDNYRIGMGGGAVSSVNTGGFSASVERKAIQRTNPEMEKRVANVIRSLVESDDNPIKSIHDHGAGGHLNCLTELLEKTGGTIFIDTLPIGDETLSYREIICNESQERIAFIVGEKDVSRVEKIAKRERCPFYVIGEVNSSMKITFIDRSNNKKPVDIHLKNFLGDIPRIILNDELRKVEFEEIEYDREKLNSYVRKVLSLESVGCKDWLTNKVDRSVTGKVAKQQTCGKIQLPLNNLGIMAQDFENYFGIANSIGHAPVAALIDVENGTKMALIECLTNLVWANLSHGFAGISLSANWMWASNIPGELSRLYRAVKCLSETCINLNINIPTGKDSLQMTQKYKNGCTVNDPGTVIISSISEVNDIRKTIEPALKLIEGSMIIYINFSEDDTFQLGGSAFSQVLDCLGKKVPQINNLECVKNAFVGVQTLIADEYILAGHDISSGGLITTLLEMCFTDDDMSMKIDLSSFKKADLTSVLLSEQPAVLIQIVEEKKVREILDNLNVSYYIIGHPIRSDELWVTKDDETFNISVGEARDIWFKPSFSLDKLQTKDNLADSRFKNFKIQPLKFSFPTKFINKKCLVSTSGKRPVAAVIREQGSNGEREMAHALYLAGFNVKDIHMTDIVEGKENLADVNFIVFVGGFSNSDVPKAAKGWASLFRYSEKVKVVFDEYYKREDTLSLGVCNGCQLMVEIGVFNNSTGSVRLDKNDSRKFESSFVGVDILPNNSVLLSNLSNSSLGIWVAHGEGKFSFDNLPAYPVLKYSYSDYPGNPNGSEFNTAGICTEDGRHLAIMPHMERSIYKWNWAYYPEERKEDELSPWLEPFISAKDWIQKSYKTKNDLN